MLFIFQTILFLFLSLFAWVSFRDLKKGIYLTIFLLPAYLVRFSLFGIPTTLLEMMIYILFSLWLLQNRRTLQIIKSIKRLPTEEKYLFYGAIFLFVGVIFSTLHSQDLRTSLGVLKGWFLDPFLFFIIFINAVKTQRQTVAALLSFIFSGLTVAVISLVYVFNNVFTFDLRLRAFYESPNYLAMYIAPGFLFALYLFVLRPEFFGKTTGKDGEENVVYKMLKSRSSRTFLMLILMGVLLLTKSYGAILGIAAALSLFFIKKSKAGKIKFNLKHKKIFLSSALVVLLAFSFLSYQKYEQVVNSNERSSFHSRLMIWNASLAMLKDSPIWGIGPGTFQPVYLNYQSRFAVPYLEWAVAEPHNTLLAFYLQSGLVGLIGFILLLFYLYKKSKIDDIVFLFLVYFLVHGLVDTLYWKNDLSVIFWMVIGLGYLQEIAAKENDV